MPSSSIVVEPPPERAVVDALAQWRATDELLGAALRNGTTPAAALTAYGLRLCQRGEIAEAARVFHAGLFFNTSDPEMWNNLAVALDRAGALAQAMACLEKSLSLKPAQQDTWLLLGGIRKKCDDVVGAETAYKAALELDADSFLAWQCLGILKQEMNAHAEALRCFVACIRHGGATPAIHANVGKLSFQMGHFAEAVRAYAEAMTGDSSNANYAQMLRRSRFLAGLIAGNDVDAALDAYFAEVTVADRALPEVHDLLRDAYSMLSGFHHGAAAVAVARKRVELFPHDETALYLLQAVMGETQEEYRGQGGGGMARSPRRFIVETFDRYAGRFEEQLVKVLGYDVPERLCQAVGRVAEPGRLYHTLDAGCGTGLCAPYLRSFSRTLAGIDLSPKMLELARGREAYDRLECGDIVDFLRREPGAFDLMVAADVLIYFGDLDPLFRAAAEAVLPGGLLAVSTEMCEGDGYRLLPTGRFAHATAYVRGIAGNWFEECLCVETTLRMEAASRVAGHFFVFRRRQTP